MTREDVNEAALVDDVLAELTRRCGGYPGPAPGGWAYLAAQAVRGLNHASLDGGYPYPGDVDAVVAELHTLAQGLPQALTQAAWALAAAHDAGEVVDVTDPARTDTTVTVDVVGALNLLAAAVTDRLEAGLARVHSASSRLAYTGPFTDDDQGDGVDSDGSGDVVDQADENHPVRNHGAEGSGRGRGA